LAPQQFRVSIAKLFVQDWADTLVVRLAGFSFDLLSALSVTSRYSVVVQGMVLLSVVVRDRLLTSDPVMKFRLARDLSFSLPFMLNLRRVPCSGIVMAS
jgi:hypothetical protein